MICRSALIASTALLALIGTPGLSQQAMSVKHTLESDAAFLVAATLDRDRPASNRPDLEWRGVVVPQMRVVVPGRQLVLVNLTYENVTFTFKKSFFVEPGTVFTVERGGAKVLRVREGVTIGREGELWEYSIRSAAAFFDYPGPYIRTP